MCDDIVLVFLMSMYVVCQFVSVKHHVTKKMLKLCPCTVYAGCLARFLICNIRGHLLIFLDAKYGLTKIAHLNKVLSLFLHQLIHSYFFLRPSFELSFYGLDILARLSIIYFFHNAYLINQPQASIHFVIALLLRQKRPGQGSLAFSANDLSCHAIIRNSCKRNKR